jgi:hypothetical protein
MMGQGTVEGMRVFIGRMSHEYLLSSEVRDKMLENINRMEELYGSFIQK